MKITRTRQLLPMNRRPCRWNNGGEEIPGWVYYISVPFTKVEYTWEGDEDVDYDDAKFFTSVPHEDESANDIYYLVEAPGFDGLVWARKVVVL